MLELFGMGKHPKLSRERRTTALSDCVSAIVFATAAFADVADTLSAGLAGAAGPIVRELINWLHLGLLLLLLRSVTALSVHCRDRLLRAEVSFSEGTKDGLLERLQSLSIYRDGGGC